MVVDNFFYFGDNDTRSKRTSWEACSANHCWFILSQTNSLSCRQLDRDRGCLTVGRWVDQIILRETLINHKKLEPQFPWKGTPFLKVQRPGNFWPFEKRNNSSEHFVVIEIASFLDRDWHIYGWLKLDKRWTNVQGFCVALISDGLN